MHTQHIHTYIHTYRAWNFCLSHFYTISGPGACMYVCMYVCMCIFILVRYACMQCNTYICMYNAGKDMHTRTYLWYSMYVCMYVCMCVCILVRYACMQCNRHICMYNAGKDMNTRIYILILYECVVLNPCMYVWCVYVCMNVLS